MILKLENLAIGYGKFPVLSGVSLTIARGSFTAILGPNGSGKSTLLKTILGLLPPLSGRVEFPEVSDGVPTFGYVPQSTQFDSLYLLTAFDVALMGIYRRIGPGRFVPKEERSFVTKCMEITAATEFADQRFSELSGGQKQRVLIARALAVKPELLILDEPTAGVDTATTKALLEFISRIHEEQKLTILLVTHDLPLVRRHAQQVVWLHDGQILNGTVDEILSREKMAELLEVEIA